MSVAPSSENGPYSVLLKKGEFVDQARGGRKVPFKIYHPSGEDMAAMPVILWSHGFGGNRDGAGFLSRMLASHGFILVHLTHDGTDSSLWEGKPGHPWDILKTVHITRENTLARFADVPFVLDQLPLWAQQNPDVGAYMDFSKIGMSGHSFGAMTTQVMAGQLFPLNDGSLISMRDPRIKAGIAYSPTAISHLSNAPPQQLYGPIAIPMLHMTGTKDDSPVDGYDYKHRLMIFEHSGHAEKYLKIITDGDHMIYNGTRGQLEVNPLREIHEDLIKVAALGFWNAQLKNDEKARAWLEGGGAAAYMAAYGEFRGT
jgi:predicted dienelactone hydrolase